LIVQDAFSSQPRGSVLSLQLQHLQAPPKSHHPQHSPAAPPAPQAQEQRYNQGNLWIRAVEAPNFHKYLQTKPEYTPGTAILNSYTTAGQFQIVSGQLVQLIAGGGLLYANVEQNTTAAVKLAISFNTTKNVYGTFVFSGDAMT
jgi:hypothetical protein